MSDVLAALGLDHVDEPKRSSHERPFTPSISMSAESPRQERVDPPPIPAEDDKPVQSSVCGLVIEELPHVLPNALPAWLRDVEAIPRVEEPYLPGPPDPILPSQTERGVLAALAAAPSETDEVDLEAVFRMVIEARPLVGIPFLKRSSLRRGMQLLLDRGEGMLPFRNDQVQLARALARLVPDLDELVFHGCPTRTLQRSRKSDRRPIHAPPAGSAVVAVTDLGISGRYDAASVREWGCWATSVAVSGAIPIALVPYSPARWPAGLPQALHVAFWDRSTTAAKVRIQAGWR